MRLAFALLQAAALAQPAPTAQGRDVIDLFATMCVETAGQSGRAHGFDQAPALGRPMTADEMARVMPGTVVTEGWITKSPNDAWAAIWFAPAKRTCGVTVRAADPAGLEAALTAKISAFYGSLGFPVTQRPDETAAEGGVTVHRASWIVTAGTHELAIIASFGDKPIGAHQHLMTFTMLH